MLRAAIMTSTYT